MKRHYYIKRNLEKSLLEATRQFPSVVVTGPRQSGKSTLLKHLFSKTHTYLTFDDLTVRERAIADPKTFLEDAGDHVILDEIQYVPQLLSYIKILIDERRSRKGRFLFTGSQQFALMKNLGDSLAGRIAILELLPFSVEEKLKGKMKGKNAQKVFVDVCLKGAYPELVIDKTIDKDVWYSAYLQTYLERDVRSMHNIGNLRDFQRFIRLLAARCAQVLNLSSLSAELGVAVNTIKRWVSVLEASRLIYLLPPYYQNLGKRITKSPKLYFLDCGLACYLLGIKDQNYLLNGSMAGAMFENFCIQETIKAFFQRGERERLYYVRTHNGLEVDLLIDQGGKVYPVEFKKSKTIMPQMAQPINRFKGIFSDMVIERGKIVSLSAQNVALTKDASAQHVLEFFSWLSSF